MPAYNYTWKEATGFSPYYLLFGHTPRLSVDVLFNLPSQDQQASYEKYVTKWHSQMKEAYEIASITAQKEAWQSQREKSREALVILGGCSVCGSESKSPNIPVYEFKPQKGGKSDTIHRNLFHQCTSLPVEKPYRWEQNKKREAWDKRKEKLNNVLSFNICLSIKMGAICPQGLWGLVLYLWEVVLIVKNNHVIINCLRDFVNNQRLMVVLCGRQDEDQNTGLKKKEWTKGGSFIADITLFKHRSSNNQKLKNKEPEVNN